MGMRHRWGQIIVGLVVLLGVVGGTGSGVHAAAQTCAQLEAKVEHLQTLLQHVSSEEARQNLYLQIEAAEAQMVAQNCVVTRRAFSGDATTWTDTGRAPGPYSVPMNFSFDVHSSGAVDWTLPKVVLPQGVTVEQQAGRVASGASGAGGYLSLTAPIKITFAGMEFYETLNLSTDNTISTRSGAISGSRVTNGVVVLVGSLRFDVLGTDVNVQSRFVGIVA